MIPVTVMVTTRNEEANIDTCLRSVHGLVDQILVIDSESEDRTVPIARRYADDVYNLAYVHGAIIPWIFQWGLDNLPIRNEWVLILEADQVVPPDLGQELVRLFGGGPIAEDGFFIRRKQIFRGRWIRFGGHGLAGETLAVRDAGPANPVDEGGLLPSAAVSAGCAVLRLPLLLPPGDPRWEGGGDLSLPAGVLVPAGGGRAARGADEGSDASSR